jgi:TolB-like protein/Flp pilus assembly protein TadD/class 3 adenylate cyclase
MESSELKFDIGHVLFIDIVGYSKLLLAEQSDQIQTLREIVRDTEQFKKAEAEGKLLRLPTGDGGALVFRNSLESPVLCALEISKALKSHPELKVRMGIHSGPVNEITDLNEQSNIAGVGINLAQRVMDCGDAGHILLSKRVADDLEQYPQWRSRLSDLGECEVKHGARVSVVNLYTGDAGNPKSPQKFTKPSSGVAAAAPISAPRRRKFLLAASAVIAVLILAAAGWFFSRQKTTTVSPGVTSTPMPAMIAVPAKSIAVLPFDNLSDDKSNAFFAEGVQDEILTRLAKVADLKVISRTSTQRFKSSPTDLRDIAKQLGVMNILEGSVQKANDQVRVNVQLINAMTDAHLWAEIYDRQLTDIFAVESDIAKTIADTLQAKLTGAERQAMASKPTDDSEAYQLYLQGRFFWNKRTAPDLRKSIDFFQQAIAKDPNYAVAYAGMAQSWLLLPAYDGGAPNECFPEAERAAEKALTIDPSLSDGHTALAAVKTLYGFDYPASIAEFEQAIKLNPNDSTAHHWLGNHPLTSVGELDRALSEVRRAQELDPLSLVINSNVGEQLMYLGRYDEAVAQVRKTLEMDGSFYYARYTLGQALQLSGKTGEAEAEYRKAIELTSDPISLGLLGNLYATTGRKEEAQKILEQLIARRKQRYIDASIIALVYVGLGNHDEALNWLEQNYRDRNGYQLSLIRIDPFLAPLRGDPRFEALAEKIVPAREFAGASTAKK